METPPASTTPKNLTRNSLTPCRRVGLGRPSSGSLKKLVQVRTISTPTNCSSYNANPNSLPEKTEQADAPILDSPLRVFNGPKQNYTQTKESTKVRRRLTQKLKSNESKICDKQSVQNVEMETSYLLNGSCLQHDDLSENTLQSRPCKKLKSESSSPISCRMIAKEDKNINLQECNTVSNNSLEDSITLGGNKEITDDTITQLLVSLLEKRKKLEQLQVQESYAKKHDMGDLRAQTARWRAAGQEALRHCVRLAREAGFPVTIPQLMERHGFPPHLMGYNADDDEFD